MANQREISTILENFEDEYTHDLAIHLYSTYLLHQVDPIYPREKWSSWPQPFDTVPDPKTEATYMQTDPLSIERKKDPLPECTRVKLIHGVKVNERITSPEEDLKLELRALIERNIYKKVHEKLKVAKAKKLSSNSMPVVEIKDHLIGAMVEQLTVQVDDVIDNLVETRLAAATRRHGKKLMNWLDVLISKLNADIEANETIDVQWYRDLYTRLDNLFSYKYQYEYERANGSETSKSAQSRLPDDVESSSEDTEASDEDSIDVPVFDYETFVDEISSKKRKLPDSRSQLSYQNYKVRTQRKKELFYRNMQAKRQVFLKLLEVRERLQTLSWENKFNISRKKLKSTRKIPGHFAVNQQEQRALSVPSLAIDEDTYII